MDGEDGHHGYFVNTISVAQSTVRGASSYLGRGGPSLYKYQFGTLINGVSGTGYGSTGSGGSSGGLSTNG